MANPFIALLQRPFSTLAPPIESHQRGDSRDDPSATSPLRAAT